MKKHLIMKFLRNVQNFVLYRNWGLFCTFAIYFFANVFLVVYIKVLIWFLLEVIYVPFPCSGWYYNFAHSCTERDCSVEANCIDQSDGICENKKPVVGLLQAQ